jgi:hypothetical protein
MSKPVQVHPSTLATDPSGQQVTVDLGILSLVAAVWDHGWSTLASCQNMGEGIRAGGAPGGGRAAAFFDDYAWLKMPPQDVIDLYRLLATDGRFGERLENWTRPGGWFAYCLHGSNGPYAAVHIYFPAADIPEVHAVLDPSTTSA